MEYPSFNKNNSSNGILDNYKIRDLMNKFVVQRDDNRAFYVLNSINDYIEFQSTFKPPIFHEVILTNKPRKFFLDLDYKVRIRDTNHYESVLKKYTAHVNSIKQLLISVFNSTYIGNYITTSDILEVVSHEDVTRIDSAESLKFSMNIVLDKYLFPNQCEFAHFGNKLMAQYNKITSGNRIIDDKFFKIMSANFIQNRLIFSTKSAENRFKYPMIDNIVISNSTNKLFYAFILQSDIGINGNKLETLKCICDVTVQYNRNVKEGTITDSFVKCVLASTEYIWKSAFVPRTYRNESPIIYFDRIKPSYCEHCEEIHHNDNTLYYYIADNNYVYSGCLQKRNNKILVYDVAPSTRSDGDNVDSIVYTENTLLKNDSTTNEIKNAVNPRGLSWYDPLIAIGANIHKEVNKNITDKAFTNDNLLIIKAEMKMGKSKALINYISDNDSFKRIVFVSFRRTFSSEAKHKYQDLGFKSYSDIDGAIDLDIHNRIIIQVESLSRIMFPIQNIDLLILDEVESIWSQVSSSNFKDFYGSYNVFECLLRIAGKIVAMDANASIRTSRLFARLFKEMPNKTINVYINEYNTNWDTTFYVIDKGEWLTKIVKSLKDTKENIAIFSNSLKEAKILKAFVAEYVGAKSVKLYGSKTKESTKQTHFSDVNKYWSQYRCIICTPTVSAGVSFEVKHFDYVFGYFTDKSCNVETCRQMLGRVRNVASKEIYITMSVSVDAQYLVDIRKIKFALARNRTELVQQYGSNLSLINFKIDPITGDCSYDDNLQLNIILENIAFDNRSRNKFYKLMCKQISGEYNNLHIFSGITYKLGCDRSVVDPIKIKYKNITTKTKYGLIEDIANADNLDEEKYNELINKSRNMGDIVKAEHASIDKYIIKRVTKLDFEDIKGDIVKVFNKKQKQQALLANRAIFSGDSWEDSINSINNGDKERYERTINRSKDNIMFKGKIHMLIRDICKAFTYINSDSGINLLDIAKSGVTLYSIGYNYNADYMKDKIMELLPMIDLPYDGVFTNTRLKSNMNLNSEATFTDFVRKLSDILRQVYGFAFRGSNGSITLFPMKNVIYIHDDKKYCNGKLLNTDKKYPIVDLSWTTSRG